MATTTKPKARIARITGTVVVPGVSKNRRLYTKANIAAAHEALSARLADPAGRPVTMFSHHGAANEDDTTRIAGHLTGVSYDPKTGKLAYEADIADTQAGHDILGLAQEDENGRKHLGNVSLRGWWNGPVESKVVSGQQVTTADELEVDGLDFTHRPGVDEATIDNVILESVQRDAGANAAIIEAAPEPAELHTAEEAALADLRSVSEAYVSMNVGHNGTSVSTSSYGADPAKLKDHLKRHAAAVQAAAHALGVGEDDDDTMTASGTDWESTDTATAASTTSEAATASTTPAATGQEATVPNDQTTTETATAGTDKSKETSPTALTAEAVQKMIVDAVAAATKPATTTEAADTTSTEQAAETATEATNTGDGIPADLVEALKAKVRDELLAEGVRPGRKGEIRKLAESGTDKPLHEMTDEEFRASANQAWAAVMPLNH